MSEVASKHGSVTTGEAVAWFGAVAVLTLFVYPFLGVFVALILSITRLRKSRTALRAGLVAFAIALVVFQVVVLQVSQQSVTIGPAIQVDG